MQFKDLLKCNSDVERDASQPGEKPVPGKCAVVADKDRRVRQFVQGEAGERLMEMRQAASQRDDQ